MPAQTRVESGIDVHLKRLLNYLEDQITAMVDEVEAKQRVSFGGPTKPNTQFGGAERSKLRLILKKSGN